MKNFNQKCALFRFSKLHSIVWAFVIGGVIALFMTAYAAPSLATEHNNEPYRVVDGKVDRATFLGWRVFHSACYTCHGVDATGTSVGPNLVEKVKDLSAADFATKVLTRYRITLGFDEAAADDNTALRQAFIEQVLKYERGELIMPAWQRDPNVRPHILDIYAYLRARSDGILGEGRPEQLSE